MGRNIKRRFRKMEFLESIPLATTVSKAIGASLFCLSLNRKTMDQINICEVVEGMIVGRE